MKRREFIKLGAAALATGAVSFANLPTAVAAKPHDMVAVRNGSPEKMFDEGIAVLGTMSAFVKPGQTVVVKPNIGWDVQPERAANTNPGLVAHIVKRSLEAGAKEVLVFDHTCDNWRDAYQNSGIESAVKNAGGKVVPANNRRYYREVRIPNARRLHKVEVHELFLDADVVINVPIIKHHGGGTMTVSMKNLMGVVYDRPAWHRNDLHQCIADFASVRKPDLVVVDGYRALMRNGPRGYSVEDVSTLKMQVLGTDMIACDAAAARIFGLEPSDVRHITLAHESGTGNMDLSTLNIARLAL